MLDTIRFLESVGRDQISIDEYTSSVALLGVADDEREALLTRDHDTLAKVLGARAKMFFGVFAPDEEPLDDEPVDTPEGPAEPEEKSA